MNGNSKIALDDLASNPALAHDLAPGTVASLLGQARIAVAVLEARLLVASTERRDEPGPTNQAPARLMTAAEVSKRLGFKEGYVYELARAGKIGSRRQGKYVRFTEAALSEFIASNGSDVYIAVKPGDGAPRFSNTAIQAAIRDRTVPLVPARKPRTKAAG